MPADDPTTPPVPSSTPWNAGPPATPAQPAPAAPAPGGVTQPVPVPADEHLGDAVGGASTPARGGFSRRRFIAGAAGVGVAGAAALALTHDRWGHLISGSGSGASVTSGKGILVMVTLYGGNDGLNTVIPYQDSQYLQGRPNLGYKPDQVLPLADGLAFHPNLKGMKALWDAKQLAVVRGVGYPDPVLSHFRGMDIWQTGAPDAALSTGVFGRWLDATGRDPMRAISVGSTLPRLLTGERSSGTAVTGGSITIPGGTALAPVLASYNTSGPDRSGLAALVAQSGADLLQVQHNLADLLSGTGTTTPGTGQAAGAKAAGGKAAGGKAAGGKAAGGKAAGGKATGGAAAGQATPAGQAAAGKARAAAPATTLAAQLDLVAQLITAGSPSRLYQVSMGGFDNHAQEKDTHARLMGQLDTAISGFMTALNGHPVAKEVVLMTYSEFGRRVAENASGGTDHGTAAPLFVVGQSVKGGQFYGDEPSLTNLDTGNLKFTTDFRRVYATMLAHVIGVDPKVALNGSFPTLQLF